MKQVILGCAFLLITTPALAAPSISVEKPTHDFGTINQGQKVDHLFAVKNRGDEPLTITQIRSSCGCTAATLSTKTIPPGKSGEVKVTFDSTNFADQVTKTVHLDSNDPRNPSTVLTMQGKIVEIIAATPRTLNLGSLKAGSRKEVMLKLENRGTTTFTVTSVHSPMAAIVGTIREGKVNPGKSGEITVTVAVPREGRFLSGYLTIQTDSPLKRELTVPIYATITP
jgi:uncharacterized cupredoxin-like copper-binding protein